MGTILAQGDFRSDEVDAFRQAAEQAGQELELVRTPEEAGQWLSRDVPTAVLTLGVGPEACQVTTVARTELETPHVAVIAVTEDVGNSAFSAAMSWGADDLLMRAPGLPGLVPRLEAAVRGRSRSFSPRRGVALLADAMPTRQVAFRRTLEGAGFGVRVVDTEAELAKASLDLRVALWVVSTNFFPDPLDLLRRGREAGVVAKAVFVAEGDQFELLSKDDVDDGYRLLRGSAPADHLVFLANEMSRPDLLNQRGAPRALFGTAVRFVEESSSDYETGYSYNVSEQGVYVRTMAPPTRDRVQIEICPPGSAERLSLEGEVAWSRPFGADGQATAPPGFGMKLVGPEDALGVWRHALTEG